MEGNNVDKINLKDINENKTNEETQIDEDNIQDEGNSKENDTNKSRKSIIRILEVIGIILGAILSVESLLSILNSKFTDISNKDAIILMRNYGEAYVNALAYKEQYMNTTNETEKENIKTIAMSEFRKITTDYPIQVIEEGIFDSKMQYRDVADWKYIQFEFTDNLEVDNDKHEIIVKDSYIIKVNKKTNERDKCKLESKAYKFKKRYVLWGDIIIVDSSSYSEAQ